MVYFNNQAARGMIFFQYTALRGVKCYGWYKGIEIKRVSKK
jgi:hypothetical protein